MTVSPTASDPASTTGEVDGRRARPEDSAASAVQRRAAAKRETILDAAARVFLDAGYGRSSVDAIAAEAGAGKQTVYNHFGDKERLFLAVLDHVREQAWCQAGAFTMPDTGDPHADLTTFAEHVLDFVLSPRMAALHRLTIAELPHHPELQRLWREGSDQPAIDDECAAYLTRAHRAGLLEVRHPALATRQLSVLVIAEGRIATLQGTQPLAPDRRRRIAEECADLIVRAHRAPSRSRARRP